MPKNGDNMLKRSFLVAIACIIACGGFAVAQIGRTPMLFSAGGAGGGGGSGGAIPTNIAPTSINASESVTTGTIITTFLVTTSNGDPFTGSMSIITDADGVVCASVPCTLSGTSVTAAVDFTGLAGTHQFVTTATMNSNTIQRTISLSITSGSSPTPPTQAVNAGFTTLADDFNFSDSFYANTSNWLDCNNSNSNVMWHAGFNNTNLQSKCTGNISQAFDSVAGQNVLRFHWPSNFGNGNCAPSDSQYIESVLAVNQGTPLTTFRAYPKGMYLEYEARIDNTGGGTLGCEINSLFLSSLGPENQSAIPESWYEPDPGEITASQVGDGAVHHWMHGGDTGANFNWTSFAPDNTNVPPGWSVTGYHKYGYLITQNGTTTQECHWIDDVFQACTGFTPDSSARYVLARPMFMLMGANESQNGFSFNFYVKNIHVWSCSNWANQMTQFNTPVCTGSTLTSSGGLSYYH